MSPRTPEQFAKIRENKIKEILSSALDLFANEGYHQASIARIAKKANISKGLIYNYFDSKEELLKELIEIGFETLIQPFDPNKDGVLTEEEFEFFVKETFKTLKQNPEYWKLYFSVLLQPRVLQLAKTELFKIMEPFLQTMYNYYRERGNEKPEAEAFMFAAALDGIGLHYILQPDNYPLEDIINLIIERFK